VECIEHGHCAVFVVARTAQKKGVTPKSHALMAISNEISCCK
jgi:hypothetical protein